MVRIGLPHIFRLSDTSDMSTLSSLRVVEIETLMKSSRASEVDLIDHCKGLSLWLAQGNK